MLRKRNPKQDDAVIYDLVEKQLLPFSRKTVPDMRISPSLIRKRLKGSITYMATSAGRSPIGFISFRLERDKLNVDMLAVNRNYQGKGVGTRLMQKAERTAAEHGCREVRLWVDEVNPNAQQFYVRHGYNAIHYDKVLRCYLMVKELD